MKLGLSIAERWRAAARMLALVAALALVFGVHPPHAEAANAHHGGGQQAIVSHSHFGSACLQAAIDETSGGAKGAVLPGHTTGHTDCTQVFDPLQRPALLPAQAYVLVSAAALNDLPFRRLIISFDPPPPRHS